MAFMRYVDCVAQPFIYIISINLSTNGNVYLQSLGKFGSIYNKNLLCLQIRDITCILSFA